MSQTRTRTADIENLESIVRRVALADRVEYDLELRGLVTTTGTRPHARLTDHGRDLLSRHYANSNPREARANADGAR